MTERAGLSMAGLGVAALAFARTRWLHRTLRTRDHVARYQETELRRLLRRLPQDFAYYRELGARSLAELPVMDKQRLLASFDQLNRPGLRAEDVRAALAAGRERLAGHAIGQSTGTSGNRGYYVITDLERYRWLGTLLGKALPDALWRRHRVALALPGLSSLYRAAASGSRISLRFFDLGQGVDRWAADFSAFAPDTVVGTPKVLRRLAELGVLRPSHLFSGAEVLDPLDRQVIEAAAGTRVREIYMATEGLFGVACAHGTLHLAEDVVHLGWEPAGDGSGLQSPEITDFTRRAQAMVRYRMNDLLALDPLPCACGLALQPVLAVHGRKDDVFWLPAGQGWRMVTPDVVRNTIVDASELVDDFRAIQTGADSIDVSLPAAVPEGLDETVRLALATRLAPLSTVPLRIAVRRGIEATLEPKLRRVRRAWTPPGGASE